MRTTRIVGDLGEYFTALNLTNDNKHYTVDLVDSKGIDLVAYPADGSGSYGISVKSRNVAITPNSSILLRDKDIDYCWQEARGRNAIPCFSFVVFDQQRIDILVITFDQLLSWRDADADFDRTNGHFNKTNLSVNIGTRARDQWADMKDVILHLSLHSN